MDLSDTEMNDKCRNNWRQTVIKTNAGLPSELMRVLRWCQLHVVDIHVSHRVD